ncbi:MAG: c-type cytochrome [Acidobacteriota bacterium]|jgi:mono/diheme cytochrome c family protein
MKRNISVPMILACLFLLFAAVPSAWVLAGQDDDPGKALYDSRCKMCHGEDGKADTRAGKMMKTPDLTTGTWKHGSTLADVEKVVTEGAGKMPKFEGKLTADQIKEVSQYILKFAPSPSH